MFGKTQEMICVCISELFSVISMMILTLCTVTKGSGCSPPIESRLDKIQINKVKFSVVTLTQMQKKKKKKHGDK